MPPYNASDFTHPVNADTGTHPFLGGGLEQTAAKFGAYDPVANWYAREAAKNSSGGNAEGGYGSKNPVAQNPLSKQILSQINSIQDSPEDFYKAIDTQIAPQIRGQAEAGANRNIASIAARTGGDTSSPLYQALSTSAVGGARASAGGEIARQKFNALTASKELQARKAQLLQALMGEQNQFTLGEQNVGLGHERLGLDFFTSLLNASRSGGGGGGGGGMILTGDPNSYSHFDNSHDPLFDWQQPGYGQDTNPSGRNPRYQ